MFLVICGRARTSQLIMHSPLAFRTFCSLRFALKSCGLRKTIPASTNRIALSVADNWGKMPKQKQINYMRQVDAKYPQIIDTKKDLSINRTCVGCNCDPQRVRIFILGQPSFKEGLFVIVITSNIKSVIKKLRTTAVPQPYEILSCISKDMNGDTAEAIVKDVVQDKDHTFGETGVLVSKVSFQSLSDEIKLKLASRIE